MWLVEVTSCWLLCPYGSPLLLPDSELTSMIIRVRCLGAHFMFPFSARLSDHVLPSPHSSFPPFLIFHLKSSHTLTVPSSQDRLTQIKYLNALHSWHHSKGYQTSYLGLPHRHLCLVTISLATEFPMASGRSFWSSNRAFISKACLLLLLWLISITFFSVCLSKLIDYCSTTVEWQKKIFNGFCWEEKA